MVEFLMLVDDYVGIDVLEPFLCNINLVFAYCFSCGKYLTINICKAYFVIVYKVKSAYSCACERLGSVSAYTAYSEYCNLCICKFFHCLCSEQKLCS